MRLTCKTEGLHLLDQHSLPTVPRPRCVVNIPDQRDHTASALPLTLTETPTTTNGLLISTMSPRFFLWHCLGPHSVER